MNLIFKIFLCFFFVSKISSIVDSDDYRSYWNEENDTRNNWSSWTNTCERSCSEPFGTFNRIRRDCVVCKNGYCGIDIGEGGWCRKHGRYETKRCYDGSECYNNGVYTGVFSEWKKASECFWNESREYELECGGGLQNWTRSCLPTTQTSYVKDTYKTENFQCSELDLTMKDPYFKTESCTLSKEDSDYCYSLYQSRYRWSEWSEWNCAECKDNISDAHRQRFCFDRINDNSVDISNCHSNRNGERVIIEKKSCMMCMKRWSEWSQWNDSLCPSTDLCKQGVRFRNRTCDGYGLECKCDKDNYCESQQMGECRLKKPLWMDCNPVDGQWSKWSLHKQCPLISCTPIKMKETRECNNPTPKNGGKNCEGPSEQDYYCEAKNCPIDGGWTEWGSWISCSVTCGIGESTRIRQCINPTPRFNGKECVGKNFEVKNCTLEKCYRFDYSMLPSNLRFMLDAYIDNVTNSLVVDENESVTLRCNSTIKGYIKEYFEKQLNNLTGVKESIKFNWIYNGYLFNERFEYLQTLNLSVKKDLDDSLIFQKVVPKDTGIYVCYGILPVTKQFIIMEVHTLAVKKKTPDYEGYEKWSEKPMTLYSNSEYLSNIYPDLNITWYLNNQSLKQGTSSLILKQLDSSKSGIYISKAYDKRGKREWILSYTRLEVKSIMSIFYNIIFWISLICIVIISCALYAQSIRMKYEYYMKNVRSGK